MKAANKHRIDLGSLIRNTFDYRSSRVIATCRTVIAFSFVIAIWLDPVQPVRVNAFGIVLLVSYLGTALILMVVAWRSWWYDHVLAIPAQAFDILVFLTAIYFTEQKGSDFVSPFLSFFAFLMLSANSRWGWRVTAWMGLFVGLCFFFVGLEMHRAGLPIDLPRFTRRLAYIGIMSLVLVWFGTQNMGIKVPRFSAVPDDQQMLLADLLAYARRVVGGNQIALAWSDEEEPRITVLTEGLAEDSQRTYPPDSIRLNSPTHVTLFDIKEGRGLVLSDGSHVSAQTSQPAPGLTKVIAMYQGLCIPLRSATGVGQLLIGQIRGMTADHLRVGQEIGREIALAMDRQQLTEVTSEAAMIRLRGSIARDLHDSVAQSLAGASFRIAALCSMVRNGGDPLPELQSLHEGLADEQNHIRAIIRRLRQNEILPGDRDLAYELSVTVAQIERQWSIEVDFPDRDRTTAIPARLVFEIQQLVREAVANAVRHGGATRVELGLGRGPHALVLTIDDNGRGFPLDEVA
ncbi:sensor histidine kinase, partial [Novosphingobium sp.]|uniref:sensor histidine kinase n=1 Tax=Novosphingobium sp. TaxID=1874826 RepID=UPI0035B47A9D